MMIAPILVIPVLVFAVAAASNGLPVTCDPSSPSTSTYRFCETTLSISERAKDLVSRLTLEEKVSQLSNSATSIPRYRVPAYQWWGESLHGVSSSGFAVGFNGTIRSATSFPQVILTAASFNSLLWHRIGEAIGIEARALYNSGQATGLTFWAPNINIFRDPRWGRGQETPGEDPIVAGQYAAAYVRGLQGDGLDGKLPEGEDRPLQASACCKHFTAYDLDRWLAINRFNFNAIVTQQDMADTYQPPFESCVQRGGASGIMCAYNRVNDIPSCANRDLLTATAREKWGFQGYITSDCDAVSIIHDNEGYAPTPEDAVTDVLKAGMDVNCGSYLHNFTISAVRQNKLLEADIDRAVHNLFSVRMRLGLFDHRTHTQPPGSVSANAVCSREHQTLALTAARAGIVLLKNSNRLLPLSKKDVPKLAVIGPAAASPIVLRGNYYGPACKNVSILQAFRSYVPDTAYRSGCHDVDCSEVFLEEAMEVARNADRVVLVMGLDQSQEREDHDRAGLDLPGKQQDLVENVAHVAANPVLLVLLSGGPIDVGFAKTDKKIGGVIWAGYPGEAGATALAEIVFGDQNPGGKLPVTWYPRDFVRVPMSDMRMRPDPSTNYPGRTYRFYQGKPVFEFGYGLSYSNYSYKFIHLSQDTFYLNLSRETPATSARVTDLRKGFCGKNEFSVTVAVENHGEMAGTHPVLLFVRQMKARNGRPLKQLAAFQSVDLEAGQRRGVKFDLNACEHLSRAMEDGVMVMEEGSYLLVVEDAQYPIHVVSGDP